MSDFFGDAVNGVKKIGSAVGDFVEEHPILTATLMTLGALAAAAAGGAAARTAPRTAPVSKYDPGASSITDNSDQGSGVGLVGVIGEIMPDENHSIEDIIGDYADIFRN